MAAQTTGKTGLSERLGRLLRSPIRVKILVLLLERTASPKEISSELGLSLSMASHHIKELLKMEMIELVAEEPRRGAVEHFYRAVLRPVWSDSEWGELSQEERQEYVIWVLQLLMCDAAIALHANTFQAHVDTHTSRSPFLVDDEGRQRINAIQNEALKESFEVEAECAERLASSGEQGRRLMAVMLCIDMPGE